MMISVTDLSSYEYCPRKLYLQKVLKIVEFPKEAMLLGNVRHETFDQMSKVEENIVTDLKSGEYVDVLKNYKEKHSAILQRVVIKYKSDLKEFNLDLSETFTKAWNSVYIEAKERALNVSKFMKKTGFTGSKLWEELIPKIDSEYRVNSKDLKMRGIIDQVRIYPEEQVPYELKTGSAPRTGVWPGHQLQVGAYIMLLKSQGKTVNSGFVSYLDLEEKRSVPYNSFLESNILKLRDEVIKLLESHELPPRIDNMNKCKSCALREKCYDDSFMAKRMKEAFN